MSPSRTGSARTGSSRDLIEVIGGFASILLVLWVPPSAQHILAPLALIGTFTVALLGRTQRPDASPREGRTLNEHPGIDELGLGRRGFIRSLWILPAAAVTMVVSALIARRVGTLHPLYKGDLKHIAGYVLWTIYQQFLLQDYFMPRLARLAGSQNYAVTIAGTLFAVAHMPNLSLTAATLVWGILSCALFERYRSVYVLGTAQGLLGLCFAISVPDAWHHHLRVGLGYLRYNSLQ